MDIYDITASALTAQRLRMDTISSNLANINTTRKADGSLGAYHRKSVVFAPFMQKAVGNHGGMASGNSKSNIDAGISDLKSSMSQGANGRTLIQTGIRQEAFQGVGVQVMGIQDDETTPMRVVYDPNHPDANDDGYVEMPNINIVSEMVDMISASRAYEANVTALQSAKSMAQAAMEI